MSVPSVFEVHCPLCDEPVSMNMWLDVEVEGGLLKGRPRYVARHDCVEAE